MNAPRHLWTSDEIAHLIAIYPHQPTAVIAADLQLSTNQVYHKADQLGLKKTVAYLSSPDACRLRRGDKVGEVSRFQPGHHTWNKGLKGLDIGGKTTRFQPGTTPPNYRPVGTIRRNSDGMLDIKVAEGIRQWVALHRWVWKLAHGSLPARGMALAFRDGDTDNCLLENLELITRRELMQRNTVHNLPKPLAELVQLRGALNRKINRLTKESHEQRDH